MNSIKEKSILQNITTGKEKNTTTTNIPLNPFLDNNNLNSNLENNSSTPKKLYKHISPEKTDNIPIDKSNSKIIVSESVNSESAFFKTNPFDNLVATPVKKNGKKDNLKRISLDFDYKTKKEIKNGTQKQINQISNLYNK